MAKRITCETYTTSLTNEGTELRKVAVDNLTMEEARALAGFVSAIIMARGNVSEYVGSEVVELSKSEINEEIKNAISTAERYDSMKSQAYFRDKARRTATERNAVKTAFLTGQWDAVDAIREGAKQPEPEEERNRFSGLDLD